jgi:hypothetical protein
VADETERWAPLHGRGYTLRGTASEKEELDKNPWDRNPPRINPSDPDYMPAIKKLHDLFDKSKVEPDAMKRHQLVWDMIKGPHRGGAVLYRNDRQPAAHYPGQEGPDERSDPRRPAEGRVGRLRQPVDHPVAGGVRPGDLVLG